MILRNRLNQLEQERKGVDLFTPSISKSFTTPSQDTLYTKPTYKGTSNSLSSGFKAPKVTAPEVTAPKTSGTFGEVAKAIGGSIGAGALNLIAATVGTAERQLVAGTDAEGLGIKGMWDNVVKQFSPETTAEERARMVKDILQFGLNLTLPQSALLRGINPLESTFNREGGAVTEQAVKQAETAVRKWADVENEGGLTKFFAGVGESLPASIATRLPMIGWYLMGNQSYRNTIEQTRAEYAAKGETMPEGLATLKALGYAGLEVATEMMFPLFGKIGSAAAKGTLGTATQGLVEVAMKKLGIKTAQEVGKLTWKQVGKAMAKEAIQEGVEEVVAGAGQAGISALTTNPDDPYFTLWSKDGGLTSLDSLLLQFASGAVMGGGMTGLRGTLKMFSRTKDVIDSISDKPIEQTTPEEKQEFKDALVLDFSENENGEQEFITNNVTNFLSKVAVNQGQTFTTNTGKIFTVPSNQTLDASKVSPSAIQDIMAIRASKKKQSPSAIPTATEPIQTVTEAPTPIQTANIPTSQAEAPQAVVAPVVEPTKAQPTKEKLSVTNADGTYNIPALEESARRLNIAMSNASNRGQRNKMNEKLKGIYNLIEYVKENPAYQKPDIKKMVQEQRDYVASQKAKMENIPAEPVKAEPKTAKKETVTETKKTTKPVNKADLLVKISNKQDVTKDVEEWMNTAEAKAEFSDVKTVEDAVEKISDTLNDMEEDKLGNHLTGNWLQMLAYKSIADKLAKAGDVKGHDISNYVAKILTAINITAPKKVAQKLIGQFNTYDLIHLVYSNVEALKVMQARIDKSNSKIGSSFTKDALQLSRTLESGKKMPTKDDVLYLTEAVKTLVESVDTDPSALVNAEKIVKRLGRLATKGGQFIQAFSVIKNLIPEYTAMKITKAYEATVLKTIPDEQQKKFEEVVEQTTEEIKKERKKAIKQTFDKIGSAVGDETQTQEIDDDAETDEEKKLTPEKLLAKRIESDVNRKAPKQKDALQKALSVLFAKYKETNPSAKKQTDIYSAVADIVINRTEYARIWDEAKPLVESSKDITDEQKKSISAYFKMLANPVMAERVLNRLVNTALKDAKINMNEEAKRYLSGKESSVDTLMQFLKSKMPNIGDSGLAYIKKYIEPMFDSKRSDKSQALIEAYYEAQKKLRARQAELQAKRETAKANRLAFKQTPAYAAKSIAKQIEAYAKITVADKPVNEFNQKLISRLMAKANEVLKRTPSNNENIYDTVSEIVMNREKYSDVWSSVQDVLKNNPDIANRSDLAKYFATMADPITANKYISRVIRANLKDMGTTVNKLAFDFFKSGDETISDFMDVLRTKMPEMDNASFEYLSKYVMDDLKRIMSTTRNQEYERLVRQNNWMAGKKNMPKLSEEQDIIALITKVAYQNALDENLDEVRKAWATRLGIPVMTEDIKNTIYQAARDMANAPDQKTKDKIYEEMVVKVGATIPSTFPEKLTAWLRTSMLFNPTTLIRNMVNNIIAKPSYEMTDVLQNAFIKHMKDIPTEQQIAGESYKRFNPNDEIGKYVMEMTDDDSVRRIQARFAKYSLAQLFGMEKKSFNTKWIQEIADATYGIMSVGKYKNIKIKAMGDIYMFQKYLRQSLYNKMIAQNYSASMTADQKASIVDNSMEYATMKAVTQTFRMKNILSSALLDLQKSVLKYGKAGEIANIGLKAITPFIITPVAITAESYKFSPLALAKNLAFDYGLAKITGKWKTKDAEYKVNTAHKISQALVGTATQFGVGMILSALGFLTGAPPEDKDEKAQWDAEGKKAYSIYIPGVGYIPIDWAQPVSTGVMIGAQTMQKMLDPKTTTVGKVGAFATESFNVLFKTSILQNISRQFGISYGQTPGSKVVDLAESLLFQGFPTLIRKLNSVIDPYSRDIYRGTEIQIFFNRILQSIPGGTYAIPKKIDVWGNEITTLKPTVGGAFGRFVNNFLSPFMASPDKMDNVTKEVTRVFNATKATKGSKALPSIASKTITRTKNNVKQTWELTPEQYIEYQQEIGKQSKTGVEKLINSSSYKNMSDDKKAEALADVYSKAVEDAGDRFIKKYPKTK